MRSTASLLAWGGWLMLAPAVSASMVYGGPLSVSFEKNDGADWTAPANQDRITGSLWITRQDRGPLYNRAWWESETGRDASPAELHDDFFYDDREGMPGTGGMRGTRWTILSVDAAHPYVQMNFTDYQYFGELGNLDHYSSFAVTMTLATGDDEENRKLSPEEHDQQGLEGLSVVRPNFEFLSGIEFGVYSIADDLYFRLRFTSWTISDQGGGFSYVRSAVPVPGVAAVFAVGGTWAGSRRTRLG